MARLGELPVELVYHIQLYALSEDLPFVNRHIHWALANAPANIKVQYILRRHRRNIMKHALAYPLVTVPVLVQLRDIVAPRIGLSTTCEKIPRRLLSSRSGTPAFAVLQEVLKRHGGDANSHNGLGLASAVLHGDWAAMALFLAHGADPAMADAWPVLTAIKSGDLRLVKFLLDPNSVPQAVPSKRRRREVRTRCEVTKAMLNLSLKERHVHIATYLREMGATPSLESLSL